MKYFTIQELCHSDKAITNGIENKPSFEHVANLTRLTNNVLDPLRQHWGSAIKVNSGYRSPEVNKLVGGSQTSDHMKGCAADLTTGSIEGNIKLFNMIQKLKLPFDQLILENGGLLVHISHREKNNRNEIKKLYWEQK